MIEASSHIGLLYVRLFIPHAQSLKDKRSVLKSLKDRVRSMFNVSLAEVNDLDKWQVTTIAVVAVGNDRRELDPVFQRLLSFIEQNFALHITEQELSYI